MWIIIIIVVFIILIALGSVFNGIDEENAKNNVNEIEENLKNKNFNTSKRIIFNQIDNKKQLRIDTTNKKIAICEIFPNKKLQILNFTDIIKCEIVEDSNTIIKGGVGRAVVGGAIAGGVGAVVGANTRKSKNVTNSLQIRIVTKDINKSLYIINLISKETQKDSTEYQGAINFANNVYATITAIINANNTNKNEKLGEKRDMKQNNEDFIEQLERLSKLKSDGMITDKEFEESKQRILASKDNNIENTEIATNNYNEEINCNNDTYNIEEKIQQYGSNNRIAIITALRKETGLGLAEAKQIVDNYIDNR